MKPQEYIPVLASILVIILVAILEKQSKLFAAIAATMPLGAPLALWIVYSSVGGDKVEVQNFSRGMMLGILPTVAFLAAVWWGARAGLKLAPLLLVGFLVWGAGSALLVTFKNLLGLQ